MRSVLTVASANVNGVRAAVRRGMSAWLVERAPDVLCLQEVRATDAALAEALGPGWHTVHEEASSRGRDGVAVATRVPPVAVRIGLRAGDAGFDGTGFDDTGSWVEADVATDDGTLTAVSAY